jgi:FHS family L-fucose permease-like MFS transporter
MAIFLTGKRSIGGGKTPAFAFTLLTGLFFIWGFITSLNDILIPYLKHSFVLNYLQAIMVQFAFFGAYFIGSAVYFITSLYYGDMIARIGYKNCILTGLLVASFACCLFYPASYFRIYPMFLAALFCLGLGFTLLQIAANPYVIILGPENGASSRLNLAQAVNSLGTTIAPLVGGFLLFRYAGKSIHPGPEVIQHMYLAFAVVFISIAIVFKLTALPAFTGDASRVKGAGALQYSNLVMGILAIFTYVGAEVCIGSFLIGFLKLPPMGGLTEAEGSKYVALYWGGLMAGRFIGAISLNHRMPPAYKRLLMIVIPTVVFLCTGLFLNWEEAAYAGFFLALNFFAFLMGRFLPARTLGMFSVILIGLLLAAITGSGPVAKWALVAAGLFNSICWSNIFTLSLKGLGKYTSQGSSLLIMAILGAAVVPVLQGAFADKIGLQYSFFVPVLCYMYLAFYGFREYRKNESPKKNPTTLV